MIAQCLILPSAFSPSRITQAILRSPCVFAPTKLVAKAAVQFALVVMASPMLPSLDTLAAMASAAAARLNALRYQLYVQYARQYAFVLYS